MSQQVLTTKNYFYHEDEKCLQFKQKIPQRIDVDVKMMYYEIADPVLHVLCKKNKV